MGFKSVVISGFGPCSSSTFSKATMLALHLLVLFVVAFGRWLSAVLTCFGVLCGWWNCYTQQNNGTLCVVSTFGVWFACFSITQKSPS